MTKQENANDLFIDQIIPLLSAESFQAAETGRRRLEQVFTPQAPDYLPLILAVPVPEQQAFPKFDRRELFYEMDKMACEQAWAAISLLRSRSDAQPAIRANTGTGTVASVFGLDQDILPEAMPWLQKHLTKDQIKKFRLPDDIGKAGLMPFITDIYRFYQKHLPMLPTYIADTQGPFDLAHLVYGDAIFYDIYDDPGFVHHLMELVTEAYIRVTEYMKSVTNEPKAQCNYGSICLTGGVRCCEDTSTLLSPPMIDQFVLPYTNRVLDHFGGGWVHYCGKNDYLLDAFINRTPGCTCFNLGNHEKHNMLDVIRRVKNAGKVYCGLHVRPKGQSLEDYFTAAIRALDGERRGLILLADPALTPEEKQSPRRIMDVYHRVQHSL